MYAYTTDVCKNHVKCKKGEWKMGITRFQSRTECNNATIRGKKTYRSRLKRELQKIKNQINES